MEQSVRHQQAVADSIEEKQRNKELAMQQQSRERAAVLPNGRLLRQ